MKIQLHRWLGVAVAWLGITSASAYDFQVDGIYYDINTDETTVTVTNETDFSISYSGEVIIPQSVTFQGNTYIVTSIGKYAFSNCSGLTSIAIPNSVTTIGRNAFSGCTGLTSIIIPESMTSIGSWAFAFCNGLTSVTIPNSVTSIGSWAFSGCTGLTSIIIPESVTTIEEGAFNGCTGLTEVTIGESVTSIGSAAFSYCDGLTSIIIPESATSIESNAFSNCTGLQSIVVAEGNVSYSSSEGGLFNKDKTVLIQYPGGKSGAYMIPSSVTTIESLAFSKCDGLTSISIPESVTTIGYMAFYNCTSLTEVTIPESVTSIGISAFSGCDDLQSIVVAEGNMSYSSSEGVLFNKDKTALIQYPGGKSGAYAIPSGVTTIGESAVYYSSGLTSVTIPNSVTSIGSWTFSSCTGLTSITIPNSVTSIGEHAFSNCTGLTEVTIGESVTSIGDLAFLSCTSLETIKSYAEVPPVIEAITFSSYEATLYVPVDCGNAYREAEYWANFTNIVESLDSHVEALQDENARVYTVGNTLHVENGGKVYQVYTRAGQLVYTGNGTTVPLTNTGIYIVYMGDYIQKVIVR